MRLPALNPLSLPTLQPSSIDERIRKVCQGLPINAVLRYLPQAGGAAGPPLHPDYVCWYNSCEDCDDWTMTSPATCSVNTTTFQENIGSIQLAMPADGNGWGTITVDPCNRYFGVWWRIQTAISRFEQIWLFGTPTSYYAAVLPSAANRRFYYYVLDSVGGTGYEDPTLLVEQGVWYWIEIWRPYTGDSETRFRVNGSLRWTLGLTGGSMGQWQSFRAGRTGASGIPALTTLVDYVRFADRFEYPPA